MSLETAKNCAEEGRSGRSISPDVRARLSYRRGPATIAIPGRGWFYFTRAGRSMSMMKYDTGPDAFNQGLARAVIDGKLAYIDRRLRIRIRSRYDWGEPFHHGQARVCSGCVEVKVDGGEHHIMTGGRWAIIDRRGCEIVSPGSERTGGPLHQLNWPA